MTDELRVEATGETVGEAKWQALRELEKLSPGLDKSGVRFQVVSEGERGLLGVGYTPARVVATASRATASTRAAESEGEVAAALRDLLERIADGLALGCSVHVVERDDALSATFVSGNLGLVIGRRGQTIDAIQHLAQAVVARVDPERPREVVVDAAGYRRRREATLAALALRSADEARATRRPVELEPMSAAERKIVHLRLKDVEGVETTSEGAEPNRFVVVRATE